MSDAELNGIWIVFGFLVGCALYCMFQIFSAKGRLEIWFWCIVALLLAGGAGWLVVVAVP